jgi:hypothetical protein
MKNLLILLIVISFHLVGCSKSTDLPNPCNGVVRLSASFSIKEIVGDTAFYADTIFRDNPVLFESTGKYDSVKWQIGSDHRTFTDTSFGLSFSNTLYRLAINFTGYKKPETACFPGDNGIYNSVKHLTPVEQFDSSTLTLSPLIGHYHGYFIDDPADTFTVRIEYFDSTKYNTSVTGTQNFYWISNIPKGYVDSTSAYATRYPELRNGLPMDMGYKGFVFGWTSSFCEYGRGWMSNDSLYINYGGPLNCRRKFIGKRL